MLLGPLGPAGIDRRGKRRTPRPPAGARSAPKRTGRMRGCCVTCSAREGSRSAGSRRAISWSAGRCWSATTTCGPSTPHSATHTHATLFHQGAPPFQGLRQADGPGQLTALAREHLSPAGQAQIAVCLRVYAALEAELTAMRHRLLAAAAHLRGAKALTGAIYGVGPIAGLALRCWLGGADRFSSSRKAVRFAAWTSPSILPTASGGRGNCPGRGRSAALVRLRGRQDRARAARPPTPTTELSKSAQGRQARRAVPGPRVVRRACHILTELGDDAFATGDRPRAGHQRADVNWEWAPSSPMRHNPRPAPAMTLSGRLRPAGHGSWRTA